MKPLLKLIIALLLLLCLADMPYGFYELVRFASAVAFVYISYDYFKAKRDTPVWCLRHGGSLKGFIST